jgi:hypothetical protein
MVEKSKIILNNYPAFKGNIVREFSAFGLVKKDGNYE